MTNVTDAQTNVITLLPCPFCGGEAEYGVTMAGEEVYCIRCGAAMPRQTSRAAAECAWNTRACPEDGAIIATEENMAEHGWFTREDVEGAFVSGYSLGSLPIGSDPRWNENEQTVDEHMAELGWVRERTCCFRPFKGETERGVCSECSAFMTEQYRFCSNCGAKVVDE